LEIADGELWAWMFDNDLPDLLPHLLEIAQRFAQRADVVPTLAKSAHRDPEAKVRLQNLLLLVHEFPKDPRTTEALLTACSDPNVQVRFRAALELGGPKGRKVLMKIAESAQDDACSAEAVTILRRELDFKRLRAVLMLALSRRQIKTAVACLEALGHSGEATAVPILAKVLAREKNELATTAARALGATGSPAAEPPLLQALERDQEDLRVAAAEALGRVGTAAAVLPLKEASERSWLDQELRRAARQAIAEIQSRAQGASPGQLSLAGMEAGQLSLAQEGGELSLAAGPAGRLSLPPEEPGT
jgi:HEAT repeat protein